MNDEATREPKDIATTDAKCTQIDAVKDYVRTSSENGYDGFKILSDGQLMVGRNHGGWALVSMSNFWDEPTTDAPVVLYTGLESRAAAEAARSSALGSWLDEVVRHPLGHNIPGDNPVPFFDAIGRILTVLREAEDPSEKSEPEALMSVAFQAYWAMKNEPRRASAGEDKGNPFDEDI